MSEFVDVPGWEPSGPRRWRVPAAVAAAAVVAVVAILLVALPRGGGPSPVAAPPTTSTAAPTTTSVPAVAGGSSTPAEGTATTTTAVAVTEPTPCTPEAITVGLGRAVTDLAWCEGGWAYVDTGDGLGDSTVLVRVVGDVWVRYTAFPSSVCRAQAAADGVPARGLPGFTAPCPEPTGAAPDLEDGALLGVGVPISRPSCDGSAIVVLGSAVTPGRYVEDVAAFLAAHPGASYLRTDRSCPSLRQATASGDPIYAVYLPVGGSSTAAICAAVDAAGGDAYGKRLDTTSDPTQPVVC